MTNAIKPDHYQNGKIDVIESLWLSMSEEQFRGFMTGNVIKYVMRYPRKGGIEDLKKAREYIDRLIEAEEQLEFPDLPLKDKLANMDKMIEN